MQLSVIGETDDVINRGRNDNDPSNSFWDTRGRNVGFPVGSWHSCYKTILVLPRAYVTSTAHLAVVGLRGRLLVNI